jgi:hypothetical protein
MLIFSITGFTLNHPEWIKSEPNIIRWEKNISPQLSDELSKENVDITQQIAAKITKETGIDIKNIKPEINDGEVYFAMPGPGFDEWLSIDVASGVVTYERSHRGVIAVLNDLHKGRDSGPVWKLFIDVIALAAIVFCITGFGLLWLYEKGRKITWPVAGLGVIAPIILFLLFVHN